MARRLSEQLTRKERIDPQLEKAGWYLRPQLKHINSYRRVIALQELRAASKEELRPQFGQTLIPSILEFKGEL